MQYAFPVYQHYTDNRKTKTGKGFINFPAMCGLCLLCDYVVQGSAGTSG